MSSPVDEVPRETPRRVRASAWLFAARPATVVAGLAWLAVAGTIAAVMSAVPGSWDDVLVFVRGVDSRGTVRAVLPTDAHLRGRPVWEIRFAFRDRAGRSFTGRCRSADPDLLSRARTGASLPVHYDSRRPERARIDGTRLSPFGAFALSPFVLAAAGAIALSWAGVRASGARRLLVGGELVRGRVVTVSVSQSPFRGARAYDVLYSFEGPGGELQGVSEEREAPRAGSEVAVLFDRGRPWRSLLARREMFLT